jgi:hypothetical protein
VDSAGRLLLAQKPGWHVFNQIDFFSGTLVCLLGSRIGRRGQVAHRMDEPRHISSPRASFTAIRSGVNPLCAAALYNSLIFRPLGRVGVRTSTPGYQSLTVRVALCLRPARDLATLGHCAM